MRREIEGETNIGHITDKHWKQLEDFNSGNMSGIQLLKTLYETGQCEITNKEKKIIMHKCTKLIKFSLATNIEDLCAILTEEFRNNKEIPEVVQRMKLNDFQKKNRLDYILNRLRQLKLFQMEFVNHPEYTKFIQILNNKNEHKNEHKMNTNNESKRRSVEDEPAFSNKRLEQLPATLFTVN